MKRKKEQIYALLSVYDKTGIVELAKAIVERGIKIISTGGTAKVLHKAKISFIPIQQITGNPEAFGGRMKTISFQIESGILYDRRNKRDVRQAKMLKIPRIDLVVCNLYPFQKTVAKPDVTNKEAIENIDVGGPTMVRAAAKNYENVTVVVDPNDYELVMNSMDDDGQVDQPLRVQLADKAFSHTADYDAAISSYFTKPFWNMRIRLMFEKGKELRYGENPHQRGWFYQDLACKHPLALWKFEQVQGKQLSYNNLLDCHRAILAIAHFGGGRPACVIVKHGNPCGAAYDPTIEGAFVKSWYLGDSLAAYGGIIIVNRPVNGFLASEMSKKFFEVLLAPEITEEAKEVFSAKEDLRVLVNQSLRNPTLPTELDFRPVLGGLLVQDADTKILSANDLKPVTLKWPNEEEIKSMLFAWNVAKVSNSNCVVLANVDLLVSSGVGQQDRKRCCELVVSKAGERAKGAVVASDAFFPFPDGPKILIDAGVTAIIQPGGSKRDQETIELCNKHGIAMVFTSSDPKNNMIRCFKH